MRDRAWLLFKYEVVDGAPKIVQIGIYSEQHPTVMTVMGDRFGYVTHSVAQGRSYDEARKRLIGDLQMSPRDRWIWLWLNREGA